ncbi:MAG: anti-anti-sigma factor [Cycloclasticus sp. symbiont of Bathymodiolus heckerae]|nr:MAG: anti-anti-sigma factor [Cycloclasticus sp. symbiont of Bathymodiolus heckerae]
MSVSSSISGTKLTINISGRFDFAAHKDFREAIDSISSNHINSVVVDMRTTDYVDSSALGMLLMLKNQMGDSKDAISLINAKPEVKKILEIANFGQLFTLA